MATDSSENFARAARIFIDFSEEHSKDLSEEGARLEAILSSLYAAGVRLEGGSGADSPKADSAAIEFTRQRVGRRFESLPFQYYSKVFNPHSSPHGELSEEVITADLIEDLLCVYSSIKSALLLWEADKQEAAIWEWRQSFYAKWGKQVLGALFALHTFYKQDDIA